MHESSYLTGKKFFDTYTKHLVNFTVVEIGSQNVNGALRDHRPENCFAYVGLDLCEGNGVDIVLSDLYKFPLENHSCDVVISSSVFEHAEMFWVSFLESLRILKPNGLLYCNVPSSWDMFHRHPVDCWRFFPDAAKGLQTWARYNGINVAVLETFVAPAKGVYGNATDWVAVFLKDERYINKFQNRILDSLTDYSEYINGYRFPANERFQHGWNHPNAFSGE